MEEYNAQAQNEELDNLSELPEELPTSENSIKETEGLPDNAPDRTKEQFQKLLKSNQELKATVERLLGERERTSTPNASSVYEEFQTEQKVSDEDYVDEEGNVNIAKLNQDLKLARREAEEAKRLSQRAKEDIEVREAHAKHPYLDPSSPSFDPTFYEIVKDRVLSQKFYQGKNTPLIRIADEVSSFYKPVKKASTDGFEKASTQMPISSSNTANSRNTDVSLDDLRERTKRGDSNAIIERLKRAGL